jgi:hypothetical protein
MSETTYIGEEDRQEYRRFCKHHLPAFARAMPSELWHYTNAEGLIGIVQTGQIWSTQVACVNDTLEQRYFGNLVHESVKVRRAQNTDETLSILLRVADEALADRDFSSAGHFVTCFSEVEDDLGQWRGYGGGECGYAIALRSDGILEALKRRPSALLLPMNYQPIVHAHLVDDVVRMAEIYFRAGLSRAPNDVETWTRQFLSSFALELDIFACVIKHPKFSGEVERRITTLLQTGEHNELIFRQKRTLLARHLPLDLTLTADGKRRLPITRILIGPGPSQQVSKISVGDLLLKFGYGGIPVELSKVPYRVP